jgi:GT2 family glycosyltransferase
MIAAPLRPRLGTDRAAIDHGCAAMSGGEPAEAARWFERACRLAPADPVAPFMLASALAQIDPARALLLLDGLIARHPLHRDAHILRLTLLHRTESAASAAQALDALLCHFAAPRSPGFRDLANAVCRAAGCFGWVGVWGDGHAVFQAVGLSLRLQSGALPPIPAGARHCALPPGWRQAGPLTASSARGGVLGARIDLAAITRTQGVVSRVSAQVLAGWALTAADPDTQPIITVHAANGALLATGTADDETLVVDGADGITRVRGFRITLGGAAIAGPVQVRAADGTTMLGSPVEITSEALAARNAAGRSAGDPWRPLPVTLAALLPPPGRAVPARRPVDVVIPLYRGADLFAACLASLVANARPGMRIVAIDDAIAEPGLRSLAEAEAASGRIVLLRHATNRGFPAAVNTGLQHAEGRDVLLLNSDTLLPPAAIARLANAAYADPHTGTVTPMTNDGTITSRHRDKAEPMPDADRLATLDAALAASNAGVPVPLPTCVGFCVYLRHDCLAATGLLRDDVFAQGYGEETDFARRAAQLGWQNVAACNVLVAHAGGASFGAAGAALRARNQAMVERLHPGFNNLVADWIAADPLGPARFAADCMLWAGGVRAASVVLVSHARGGGVARHVAARAAALAEAGRRAIIVRPAATPDPAPPDFALSDGAEAYPHLHFGSVEALAAFLQEDRPVAVELHHVADHDTSVLRLAGLLRVPFDVFVHDYAPICPQVTLCAGPDGYCGEPADRRDCEDCVADHPPAIPLAGTVDEHRARQTVMLRLARRVVAPSHDTAARYRRFVSRLSPVVTPWEDDGALTRTVRLPAAGAGRVRHVAVLGGIGHDKGFGVLLACARDAVRRNLALRFTVVGHTIDDDRLLATGRAFVTGQFAEGEAAGLLRALQADIGFLPSIWPETWCFALSALWQAGLHVTAFDLGAPAERIAAQPGAGAVLPLGLPACAINDHFLGVAAAESIKRRSATRGRIHAQAHA